MRSNHVLVAAAFSLLSLLPSLAQGDGAAARPAAPRSNGVRIESVREVPFDGIANINVKEYGLRVEIPGRKPVRIIFGGPGRDVTDEIEVTQIVGNRFLVTTERSAGVFELPSGRELLLVQADPVVTPSSDGHWVAYKESQRRFTPREAEGTIVNVVDVMSARSFSVFPEPEKISNVRPGETSERLVWEEDETARHIASGPLFWSPAATRLVFFCSHAGAGSVRDEFLVTVDLSRGPEKARFQHQLIPPGLYVKPGADPVEAAQRFAIESVAWQGEDAIEAHPPEYNDSQRERITLRLPSFD